MTANDTQHRILRYQISHADFTEALHVLRAARESANFDSAVGLLGMAVICYARPFSGNKGTGKWRKLEKDFVPRHLLQMHDRLIGLRDTVVAHSDVPEAELVFINLPCKGISRKSSVHQYLADKRDQFENLIRQVRAAVGSELNRLEADAPDLPYPPGGWI